jgi:hypothetical protein
VVSSHHISLPQYVFCISQPCYITHQAVEDTKREKRKEQRNCNRRLSGRDKRKKTNNEEVRIEGEGGGRKWRLILHETLIRADLAHIQLRTTKITTTGRCETDAAVQAAQWEGSSKPNDTAVQRLAVPLSVQTHFSISTFHTRVSRDFTYFLQAKVA